MDKRTAAALEASIEHWKRMRALAKPEDAGEKDSPTVENCALCSLFWSAHCHGCPVRAKTGFIECNGSPYSQASDAWYLWLDADSSDSKRLRANWRRQATRMIKFLESLREQK